MRRLTTALVALTLLLALPALAGDQTRWLNVHVTEAEEGANIEVHLPLSMVLTIIKSVNVENFHAGKVDLEIEDAEIDWPAVFSAIKDAPDGDFVKVTADDADVLVSKRAGTLHVDVQAKDEDEAVVKVTLPMSLVDALTVDDSNQIDVAALIASLSDLPDGDLVTVDAKDAKVRVWVE